MALAASARKDHNGDKGSSSDKWTGHRVEVKEARRSFRRLEDKVTVQEALDEMDAEIEDALSEWDRDLRDFYCADDY